MKKCVIPALIVFVLLFSACQKETKNLPDENVVITKINSWLDSQLQTKNEAINATILQLKANLDFTQLRDEEYRDGSKFIIVPLKAGFVSKSNKDKSPSNNLVLAIDKTGLITKANIIQYVPANGKPGVQIPRNALSQMYNGKPVMAEGKFSYSNLADRLLYELDFKDGKVNKFGLIKAGPVKTASKGMIEQDPIGDCVTVDWYLVTTYYYPDGTTSQTSQYAFSTCQPNNGGGGPSAGVTILPTTQKDWLVAAATSGSWMVSSTEQFTGIDSTVGGKQFTGITHLGDNGYALVEDVNVTWARQGVTTTLNGVWIATCQISGKLTATFNNNGTGNVNPSDLVTDQFISNSKDWSVNDIW